MGGSVHLVLAGDGDGEQVVNNVQEMEMESRGVKQTREEGSARNLPGETHEGAVKPSHDEVVQHRQACAEEVSK